MLSKNKNAPLQTVREATFDFLRSVEVDTIFGNPGSTELAMLDRWPDDIHYVLGLQEASVVGMADGYARATGKAAFVNLHSAAGLGHSLGNVYTAFRNRAPMVIITGQQSRELLPNYPFLGASNAVDFPKPYVKYSVEPARPEDVPDAIAQAYRIAMQRPWGPTFVSVPADDWAHMCTPVIPRLVSTDCAPDPEILKNAARTIKDAKQPAFVVGTEVDEEGVGEEMVRLAERIGAPVYAAPFAARIAFPENHPLFAGFLPAAPEKVAQALIQFDVVVAVGAPVFTYHVPGKSILAESDLSIFHLTVDLATAASAPLGTSIVGSLRFSVPQLASQLPQADHSCPTLRAPAREPARASEITPAILLWEMGQRLSPKTVLVEEAPSLRPLMQEYVQLTEWGSFFTMASGGLGYGLPAAVGHGLGKPDRKTVCLIGDGSFMYSPQALWTAVQQDLDLTVIVVNNGGYGAMRSFSKVLQVRNVPGIEIDGLEFPSLAQGMGCRARRVTEVEKLAAALDEALCTKGPFLLEVEIGSEVQLLY
ncbi:benzoylformate decarboxylase [Paracoccus saliphilus]|uniref:Benzoylformate decarboxylase n=1 Tax=Paracoccus saliphilus TaxID=405559 RepID=A0AA45W649_9RHOB|nr:benzoylformate decarboxylase [Paracoccus saliphilus]WCR01516.1 benzoylformate decarboxylase [Paracoccus saliphilus]SIS99364.1 benzoylformate decarboxylase [Paracoccus saliphilus]